MAIKFKFFLNEVWRAKKWGKEWHIPIGTYTYNKDKIVFNANNDEGQCNFDINITFLFPF